MDTQQQMTRAEFLRAAVRSWPVRVLSLLLAGVVLAYVVVGLWQARNIVAFIGIVVGLVIVAHALSYVFSSRHRRAKLDEQTRLARSHWSYGCRGMLWAGIVVAVGDLIAYWWKGGDPTGGLIAGLALAGFGAFAHIIWAVRRPSQPHAEAAGQ